MFNWVILGSPERGAGLPKARLRGLFAHYYNPSVTSWHLPFQGRQEIRWPRQIQIFLHKKLNSFLFNIESDIRFFINNPSTAYEKLNEYGSKQEQAQKIGLNSDVVKGVLEDSNSINLNYLSYKNENFENIIKKYLEVVNPSLINPLNYLK